MIMSARAFGRQDRRLSPRQVPLCSRRHIIIGNVAFYGATAGEALHPGYGRGTVLRFVQRVECGRGSGG